MATTKAQIKKQAGPKSLDELVRKGPPTREEVDALTEKYGLGLALTEEESDTYLEYYANRPNASDLSTMLSVLYPNCEWVINGRGQGQDGNNPGATDYDDLEWDEDNPLPKPTKAELERFTPFVQDILDQQEYLRLRRNAYPQESALVRALWEYVVEGDDELLHALQARRIAVKKRFPKPENKHWMIQSEDYLKILPNTPEDILRQIDEDEAKKIAFRPGVQAKDAESLIGSGTLEERAQAVITKREEAAKANGKNLQVTQTDATPQPTIADIEEAKGGSVDQTGE
mgnify:CR=1 FL=1